MRKDHKDWTFNVNRYSLNNFALGIDYYVEVMYIPTEYVARVLMLNFLFFNITVTHWENTDIFRGE